MMIMIMILLLCYRVISSHYVRSVIWTDNMLYSRGVDPYLPLHNYPTHRTTVKVPPLPPHPVGVRLAREARAVMLTYSQSLQLWRLGRTNYTTGAIGSVLPLDGGEPRKLVEVGAKQGETMICSAVHSRGQYLAFSTNGRLRLLRISGVEDNKPNLSEYQLVTLNHVITFVCGPAPRQERT